MANSFEVALGETAALLPLLCTHGLRGVGENFALYSLAFLGRTGEDFHVSIDHIGYLLHTA
jgi:hypothetical protein